MGSSVPSQRTEAGRFGTLVGSSASMKRLYGMIEKTAKVDMPVLITGETGTGKDLVANEIHLRSERSGGPFVAINLGTLSKELMVSDLFGHEKGAFTGADHAKKGRFAEADGGTLFLDEISTAEEQVQVALLRVMDQGKFRPVGAAEDHTVDTRVIAASNEDLGQVVRCGEFRQDLLHRFEVLHLQLPPLRQRKRDIPLLARYFLDQVILEFGFHLEGIDEDAIQALLRYGWPGNVRELKNVVAHAAVVAERGLIRPEHLPARVAEVRSDPYFENESSAAEPMSNTQGNLAGPIIEDAGETMRIPQGLTLDEVQRAYVLRTLAAFGNNKTQAARQLGISRKTLYDRLARWRDG